MVLSNANADKYKRILERKQSNPNLSLSQLCKEQNISYQSYNNWVKRYHKAPTELGHKVRVTIMFSIEEAATMIQGGVREVPVAMSAIIRSMTPENKKSLAEELGARQLQALIEQGENGHDDSNKNVVGNLDA